MIFPKYGATENSFNNNSRTTTIITFPVKKISWNFTNLSIMFHKPNWCLVPSSFLSINISFTKKATVTPTPNATAFKAQKEGDEEALCGALSFPYRSYEPRRRIISVSKNPIALPSANLPAFTRPAYLSINRWIFPSSLFAGRLFVSSSNSYGCMKKHRVLRS
jgi:hypothetical protein